METAYDWVTVGIFAGLIVLFLQRSTAKQDQGDSIFMYLLAGVGLAVANYFGNNENHVVAVVLILATLGFIAYYLKPFRLSDRS